MQRMLQRAPPTRVTWTDPVCSVSGPLPGGRNKAVKLYGFRIARRIRDLRTCTGIVGSFVR